VKFANGNNSQRSLRREEESMNVTHGLRRALQLNPLGIAILEGERKLTWAELGERVSRLAGALRQNGVAKGDRVAVLMLNSTRYLELYLAVAWAAAIIVPLNVRWSVASSTMSRRAPQSSSASRFSASPLERPQLALLGADRARPHAWPRRQLDLHPAGATARHASARSRGQNPRGESRA
jgi:acyl-CoA synthetase (AMP-forming)/AMP-acid ligase II